MIVSNIKVPKHRKNNLGIKTVLNAWPFVQICSLFVKENKVGRGEKKF